MTAWAPPPSFCMLIFLPSSSGQHLHHESLASSLWSKSANCKLQQMLGVNDGTHAWKSYTLTEPRLYAPASLAWVPLDLAYYIHSVQQALRSRSAWPCWLGQCIVNHSTTLHSSISAVSFDNFDLRNNTNTMNQTKIMGISVSEVSFAQTSKTLLGTSLPAAWPCCKGATIK